MGPDSALGERTQWRVVLKGCEAPTFYCVGKVIWGGQVGDVIPSHAFLGERVVPQEGVATSNAGQCGPPAGAWLDVRGRDSPSEWVEFLRWSATSGRGLRRLDTQGRALARLGVGGHTNRLHS